MELDEILKKVKKELPEERLKHTYRVIDAAEKLALRYGADVNSAKIAAALHDIAKYATQEEINRVNGGNKLFGSEIWHGHLGALWAKERFGITDEKILNAIRYHTTGRAKMRLLEKIIFLADYIEAGRHTPMIDECRALAEIDLDAAVCFTYQKTIEYLLSKKKAIYPDTIYGYNYLINGGNMNGKFEDS